jgi:hypothetical protein
MTDREQPPFRISAGLEGVPKAVGAKKRLLHEILRVIAIMRQRHRKPKHIIEAAEGLLLERRVVGHGEYSHHGS